MSRPTAVATGRTLGHYLKARALGPPDPGAPPCIRQRLLPVTAGDRHGLPERVLAPHRAARRSCSGSWFVLSPQEVARLLDAAPGLKYKAALSVAYGAGLRAAEVVRAVIRCSR